MRARVDKPRSFEPRLVHRGEKPVQVRRAPVREALTDQGKRGCRAEPGRRLHSSRASAGRPISL